MDGEELRNGCCGWRCDGQPRPAHEPQVMQAETWAWWATRAQVLGQRANDREIAIVAEASSGSLIAVAA